MYKHVEYESFEYEGITYNIVNGKNLKKRYSKWLSNLTIKEKLAIYIYKLTSKKINRTLTEKESKMKRLSTFLIMNIELALNKANFEENIIVNRSIMADEEKDIVNQFRLNNTFRKNSFCSTYSINKLYKKPKRYSAYLKILIPKGSNVGFINTFLYGFEKEILIQKNSLFQLICEEKTIFNKKTYLVKLVDDG